MQATIDSLIDARRQQRGALLPLLHDIQDQLGFIPPEAVASIASALNLSRAEVHGVISFYHHFRSSPPAQHVLQVCRAEACRAMGSDTLWQHTCNRLRLDPASTSHGATDASGAVTLQAVYCLGLCSTAPALQFDQRLQARASCASVDRLLDLAQSGHKAPASTGSVA